MTRVWGFGPGMGSPCCHTAKLCRLSFVTWFRFLKVPSVPAQGTTIVPDTSVPLSVAKCCWQKMQRSVATPCGNAQLEAVEIPTGEGTPVAMFSARFDGGPIEQKMRRVHKILVDNSYSALMVEVDAGESFGDLTAEYLGQVKADKGLMIAVCTHHYGEMTSFELLLILWAKIRGDAWNHSSPSQSGGHLSTGTPVWKWPPG